MLHNKMWELRSAILHGEIRMYDDWYDLLKMRIVDLIRYIIKSEYTKHWNILFQNILHRRTHDSRKGRQIRTPE